MDLLATEKGNKYTRSYLSSGKYYLIWNISPKKKSIYLQIFRYFENDMDSKVPFTKTHIQMATCSYAAQSGDKTDDGSKLCSPVCKFSIMDAQVAGIKSR